MSVESKTLEPDKGLYERLIGPDWQRLDAAVRAIHVAQGEVRANGVFKVDHGHSLIARFLVWLARLPAPSEAVSVQLTVTPTARGETWARVFGNKALISTQYEGVDGLLAERMGLLEQHFRLAVADGALRYTTHRTALTLGSLRLFLPDGLAPRAEAFESAVEGRRDRTWVSVTVSLPMLGMLIRYQGELEAERVRLVEPLSV